MGKPVSVIILNYNRYKLTIDCLKSLTSQTYENFEVIVVDNGSNFQSFLNLKNELKEIERKLDLKLIRNNLNLYFGAGNNKAIKKAQGKYICLLNYDTVVESNFIEEMVAFLEKHPEAGMITPKIKIYEDKNILWNTGGYIDFKSPIVVKNRGLLEYDPKNQKYSQVEEIGFAPGTAMFLRKDLIDEIGLIDEIYLMYYEDPDWNLRAQEKGYVSYYVPNTIVYHKADISFKDDTKVLFWWDSDWRQELKDNKYKVFKKFPKSKKQQKEKKKQKNIFKDYFFKRNPQILVWKFANISELIIFYFNFLKLIFLNILINFKKIEIDSLLLSLWRGFIIGVKRRTNRSCSDLLKKEYIYIRNIQYNNNKD